MASTSDNPIPTLRKRIDSWIRFKSKKTSKHFGRHVQRALTSKRTRHEGHSLPYIPPEIWGIVIYHACLLYYDPLDVSDEISFLQPPPLQYETYCASMRIKTTLSLVSRQWNALARMQLYEFVWISRARQAKALARTLLMEYVGGNRCSSGSYIRRLHIETPVLERCAPCDLRTILDYAPSLSIYSDRHSVQRSLFSDTPDPRCSPEEILKLVAHPRIRRLSWTSYGDAPFQQRMSPLLRNMAIHLEYLELSSCISHIRSEFWESLPHPAKSETQMNVQLPSLRALKVSLDNNTFAVLASWDMPRLTNLSVLSSDFSYTGQGFAAFFQAHGAKLRQLELGHSSSLVEEHYLTEPHGFNQNPGPIPLAQWCPNLKEFICSADAEWHWQTPDWIAPHILLPAHPSVELIGIRDIDTRLSLDPDMTPGEPYFPLFTQLCSLLQADAFPSLRFVRDLSWRSQELRASGGSPRVLTFWMNVLEQCQEHGVWFEDCTGVNLTARSLLRASIQAAKL